MAAMNNKEIARAALKYFNNGKRWVQGVGEKRDKRGRLLGCCLVGVTGHFRNTGKIEYADESCFDQVVQETLGRSVVEWNDAPERTFKDVKKLLLSIK